MFDNILETIKCFQDNKNEKLKKWKNCDFSRGLVHGLSKKCEVWPCLFFFRKISEKNVF